MNPFETSKEAESFVGKLPCLEVYDLPSVYLRTIAVLPGNKIKEGPY